MKGVVFLFLIFQVAGINAKRGQRPSFLPEPEPENWVPVTEKLFHTPAYNALFDDPRITEPKMYWNYFLALTEVPRGSYIEDKTEIINLLKGWATKLNLTSIDDHRNVIVYAPASPGAESWPTVCIQTHYDIVAIKYPNVTFDFDKDPIMPQILPAPNENGEWVLKANGTSLGVDDGMGVAGSFLLLADPNVKHGPLEVLITADEETTMLGAEELSAGTLHSKYMLNLDGGGGEICIGCAGGFEQSLIFPLNKTTIEGIHIEIEVNHLRGGHSGGAINAGRANAAKLLAEAVDVAVKETGIEEDFFIQTFSSGEKMNAIPSSASMSFVVPTNQKDAFLGEFTKSVGKLKAEWKTAEPDLNFDITADADATTASAFDPASSRRVFDVIHTVPHGVLRMSPDIAGLVETSINLAFANICEENSNISVCGNTQPNYCNLEMCSAADTSPKLRLDFFSRSSDDYQWAFVQDRLKSICNMGGGFQSIQRNYFPGWLADPNMFLLDVGKQSFEEIEGVTPNVFATHGGLEVGFFMTPKHGIQQAIAIGPRGSGAHTPEESLYIASIPKFYKLLVRILGKLDH